MASGLLVWPSSATALAMIETKWIAEKHFHQKQRKAYCD